MATEALALASPALAPSGRVFTLKAARTPAFTWGLSFATVIESVVVHVLVAARHPAMAWVLSAIAASFVVFLVADERALASGRVEAEPGALVLRIGLRLTARIPWALVEASRAGSFGGPRVAGRIDATRPAEANVSVRFREPVTIRLLGASRDVTCIRMCVDDPEGLHRAIEAARRA